MNQQPSTITRRDLLKWVGVAGAGSAALGTNAWTGFNRVAHADETQGDQGTWIPCNCWADCGSKGFNKVLVKDGKAIRMGTDETHPDSPDCPQLRSCARGRSLRGMVFGADRLKYPMKRKGWQPGGGENANGQMRGRDEWERISWEEAYRYIADEVERITAAYGNDSVLIPGYV
ncbi:MAG: molybdopterin-dependent oxidoreductase, partial [Coriobacteriaceae bacterium]|nr:molybdopterin-dependent oxidoreductase [Coriobacteriaceae bacterium]